MTISLLGRRAYSPLATDRKLPWPLSRRLGRWGWYLGLACSPLALVGIYERVNPLPELLNNYDYPLQARWYIRRALWSKEGKVGEPVTEREAYWLDQAMRSILKAGYGAASPQSTGLVIYLSRRYAEERVPRPAYLLASFAALTHKPHVGEGANEERARLEMAFEVADRLVGLSAEQLAPKERIDVATKVLTILDRSPPYLRVGWTDHPLRGKFQAIIRSE